MNGNFNEDWLTPGAIVPVDIPTTGALIREIQRLRRLATGEYACGFWEGTKKPIYLEVTGIFRN